MSWWRFSEAGDLMGDAAADAVGGALTGLAEARRRAGRALPALGELVAALDAEVRARAAELLEPEAAAAARVEAEDVAGAGQVEADVREAVARGAEEVIAAYREDHLRPPRAQELVYAFKFVLGGETGDYVRPPFPDRVRLRVRAG